MNNLSKSFKRFLGNKNTVTIVGVILCIFILYFGYNYRINQSTKLVKVPYAKETIQPKTKVTSDMIAYMEVPSAFIKGTYYANAQKIVGMYSNYNAVIPKGSIFYEDFLVEEASLPDSVFYDVDEYDVVINFGVTMESTYANSIMPENYINMYFKAVTDDGLVIFCKLIENIQVLAVRDSDGLNVFEASDEARVPRYMLFAIPEETFILLKQASYIKTNEIELVIVPNTKDFKEEAGAVEVTNDYAINFIQERSEDVPININDTTIDITTDADIFIP